VLQLDTPGLEAAATAYGSLFADAARARMREVVDAAVRECDLVVPISGGALALVLPQTGAGGADALAGRLGAAVRRAFAEGFLGRPADPAVRTIRRDPEVLPPGDGSAGVDDPDPLTGLAGERSFRLAVSRELRRARRYEGKVAVALFDLDGFAALDAALPREAADRVVHEAAALLRAQVREVDLAARPGEDELALLLPGTDRVGARSVAERFRMLVERRFAEKEALTISGGVSCYPEDAGSPELLLERAARALYAAKVAGGNVVR
jgi:diguanylate cyclase (GGDEF)-like protein